jgi:hypothetical protein
MSKKFNVHDIVHERQNELDSSPLFQRKTPAPTVKQASPLRSQPEDTPAPPQVTFQPPPTEIDDDPIDQTMTDGVHDVMTSSRQDVDYRAWREVIENTETHNSALRLTRQERYDIEDLISELERTHHIKTSMNELARLGLLSILHDYKQRQRESLVYQVKKS